MSDRSNLMVLGFAMPGGGRRGKIPVFLPKEASIFWGHNTEFEF
jgi:hypothetical protein